MRFGELEDDHLNPTDFSREVNKIYPVEIALHAGLTVWLFMHWEITLVLLNGSPSELGLLFTTIARNCVIRVGRKF